MKLILHWLHVDINPAVPEIPTLVSLAVILVVLAVTTVASLVKTRNDPTAKAHAGSIRAQQAEDDIVGGARLGRPLTGGPLCGCRRGPSGCLARLDQNHALTSPPGV